MTETTQVGITINELLEVQGERIEVVDGSLREKDRSAASVRHHMIIENLKDILKPYVRQHNLGFVFGDGLTYILETEDQRIQQTRLPDISFIRQGRFAEIDLDRPFIGAPDLAVEVTSPGQSAESLSERVEDYLIHGIDEVWVIYVATRKLYQYRSQTPDTITIFNQDDLFSPSDLFPNLSIQLADVFDVSDLTDSQSQAMK